MRKRDPNFENVDTGKVKSYVSSYYGVDIFNRTHKREISFARSVFAYMLMVFTDMTYKEIALEVYGKPDHASVIHANNQVRGLCLHDQEIRKQIIEIETVLE